MAKGWRKHPLDAQTVRVSVMLTEKEHAQLVELSRQTRQSLSGLCRVAISQQYGIKP